MAKLINAHFCTFGEIFKLNNIFKNYKIPYVATKLDIQVGLYFATLEKYSIYYKLCILCSTAAITSDYSENMTKRVIKSLSYMTQFTFLNILS